MPNACLMRRAKARRTDFRSPAIRRLAGLLGSLLLTQCCAAQQAGTTTGSAPWYQYEQGHSSAWASPENPNGIKGQAAKTNKGAKGRAFVSIAPGSSATLLNIADPGIIHRIWITVIDRSPEMLRSLRIDIFWDQSARPAVSAPLGDFFGMGLGRTAVFQNAVFANPEGRSFECFIPMPFRHGARVVVTNESSKPLTHLFYDVDFERLPQLSAQTLYFHTYWHRDTATTLGKDFDILPAVEGKGRFLGTNVGLRSNPAYGDSWWGEGEVKMELDETEPSLVGTGSEDYIGTGWGQGQFINAYSGCMLADQKNGFWAFYRYHIPDPVFFSSRCRVALQQLGGQMTPQVLTMLKEGKSLDPVTVDLGGRLVRLKDTTADLNNPALKMGWTNFYRSDDLSSTAYFYLDRPENDLPALQPVALRTYRLQTP